MTLLPILQFTFNPVCYSINTGLPESWCYICIISAHLDLPLHHGHLLLINIKDITMVTGQNLMMVDSYIIYLQFIKYHYE